MEKESIIIPLTDELSKVLAMNGSVTEKAYAKIPHCGFELYFNVLIERSSARRLRKRRCSQQ